MHTVLMTNTEQHINAVESYGRPCISLAHAEDYTPTLSGGWSLGGRSLRGLTPSDRDCLISYVLDDVRRGDTGETHGPSPIPAPDYILEYRLADGTWRQGFAYTLTEARRIAPLSRIRQNHEVRIVKIVSE